MPASQIFYTRKKRAELWWQRIAFLLAPLSVVFGLFFKIRKYLYLVGFFTTHRARVPVISVGNLAVGGVGKTPLVSLLVESLPKNLAVAILQSGSALDEALMLKHRYPALQVFCDSKRHLALRQAEMTSDLIILDDGLQCLRIARDLEIIVVDATKPFDNGHLLPRGRLREGPKTLAQADYIFLTNSFDAGKHVLLREHIKKYSDAPLIFTKPTFRSLKNRQNQIVPLDMLWQHRWAVFCGLGNPTHFLSMLQAEQVSVGATLVALDHEKPITYEWQAFLKTCGDKKLTKLLCTEKDHWRLSDEILPIEVYYLTSQIEVIA